MNIVLKVAKRYYLFIFCILVTLALFFINDTIAHKTILNAKSSFLEMLKVLPPIMLLLGLMDVWIPKDYFIKYMGKDSHFIGIFISIIIGSLGAGPMYAAFPFTAVLLKKGASLFNIIIFMNAWCVTKISTLLFEISSLGFKFTFVRLLIDIPGIILMGYLVSFFMRKHEAIS
ncbi:permease [Clostridium sp.]|uniref:permease n=1 Tax=Clostridium sp. TaxID=1506 RepID=UPI002FC610F3